MDSQDRFIEMLLYDGWKEYPDTIYGKGRVRNFESPFKLFGADCQTNDRPPTVHCEVHLSSTAYRTPTQVTYSITGETEDSLWATFQIYSLTVVEAVDNYHKVINLAQEVWDAVNHRR